MSRRSDHEGSNGDIPEDIEIVVEDDQFEDAHTSVSVSHLSSSTSRPSITIDSIVGRFYAMAMASTRTQASEEGDDGEGGGNGPREPLLNSNTVRDGGTMTYSSQEGDRPSSIYNNGGSKRAINTFQALVATFVGIATVAAPYLLISSHRGEDHTKHPVYNTCLPYGDNHTTLGTRVSDLHCCANQISGRWIGGDNSDKPRRTAIEWFLSGGGRDLPVDPKTCANSWDTTFAIMYSLIVTRESVKVHDPSWHSNKTMHNSYDVCRWSRVQCTTEGVINGMTFNNAGLYGSIPPELMVLTNLERLELITNPNLKGTLPTEFGQLQELKYLFVHETGVSEAVPSEIGHLHKLQQFLLDHTSLTGTMPKQVCDLVSNGTLVSLRNTCPGNDGPSSSQLSCSCCTSCKKCVNDK